MSSFDLPVPAASATINRPPRCASKPSSLSLKTPLYIALFREELLAGIYPFSQLRRLLHCARDDNDSQLCFSQVRLGLLSAVRPFVDVGAFSSPTPTKLRRNSGEHCVNPVIVFQKNTQTSEIHIS